jgi:membrane-associated phospholipid phosphatase
LLVTSDQVALFFGLLSERLGGAFVPFVLAWIVTCLALILVFRPLKPRLREKAIDWDKLLRAHLHSVRFGSREDEDEALRREKTALTWFFRFWTNFASAPCLSIISLGLPLIVFQRQWEQGPHFRSIQDVTAAWMLPGVCYGGSMLLSFVLKRVFRRGRPPLKKGDFGHKLVKDPSFPSGHSLTSFCFWGMVPVAAHLSGSAWPVVALWGVIGACIVGLTGLSRLYLRVHFPSDVAGGYLIGAVWCLMCLSFLPGALRAI